MTWGDQLLAGMSPDQRARVVDPRKKAEDAPAAPAPQSRMNKTETRYRDALVAMHFAPVFEAITLNLTPSSDGKRRRYTPDFLVPSDEIELHEVKGAYVRPDAELKFDLAREMYGHLFTFVWAQWKGGAWLVTRFDRRGR